MSSSKVLYNEGTLENVKITLRSILISYGRPMALVKLLSEFKTSERYELPYDRLGFVSAEALIKSIHDTVRLFKGRKGEFLCEFVSDKTTQHVEKFVKEQSNSKGRPSSLFASAPPPRFRSPRQGNFSGKQYQNSPIVRNKQSESIEIPLQILEKIKHVVDMYPKGFDSEHFGKAYLARYGSSFNPKQYGFDSFEEAAKTMKEQLIIKRKGSSWILYPVKQHQFTSGEDCEQDFKQDFSSVENDSSRDSPISKTESLTHEQDKVQSSYRISKDMREAFIQLLSLYPKGIWASELPQKYKDMRKKELNFFKLGFFSIIELVFALPDIFTANRPKPNSDWLLRDARFDIEKDPELPLSSTSHKNTTSPQSTSPMRNTEDDRIKALKKIYQLIKTQPKGILITKLQAYYKAYFVEDLPLRKLGCNEDEGLLSVISDIVEAHFVDQGILVTAHPKGDDYLSGITKDTKDLPVTWSPEIPSDVERGNSGYARFPLEANFKAGEYSEIYVSQVNTPTNFYIQFKKTSNQLAQIMKQLELFYNSSESCQYLMLNQDVLIGNVCIALYPGDYSWHRATITGIRGHDMVKVYYVDYGTTSNISRSLLRYIKKDFLDFPAQAIKSTVAFTRPSSENGIWTEDSKQYFLDLVVNKPLIGSVYEIKNDEVILEYLTDTTGDDDIHIMDRMREAGYACLNLEPCLPSPTITAPSTSCAVSSTSQAVNHNSIIDTQFANAYQQFLPYGAMLPMLMSTLQNSCNMQQLNLLTQVPQTNVDMLLQSVGSKPVLRETAPEFVPKATSTQSFGSFNSNWMHSANPSNTVLNVNAPSFHYPAEFHLQPSASNTVPGANNPHFQYTNPLVNSSSHSSSMFESSVNVPFIPSASGGHVSRSVPSVVVGSGNATFPDEHQVKQATLSSGTSLFNIQNIDHLTNIANESKDSTGEEKFKLDLMWKPTFSPECKIGRVKPLTKSVDDGDIDQLIYQLAMAGRKRYIKIVDLTSNHRVFLINLNGQPYLLSSDVNGFFWKVDALKRILRLHGMDIPCVTVTDQTDVGLFLELDRYSIPVSRVDGVLSITLYVLENVRTIITVIKPEEIELIEAVNREIMNFNPRDVFWRTPAEDNPRMPAEGQSF